MQAKTAKGAPHKLGWPTAQSSRMFKRHPSGGSEIRSIFQRSFEPKPQLES
jgi:hypothetical protein